MIRVSIKLFGLMRKFYKTSPRARKESVELPEGSMVSDLLNHYNIPYEKAHMLVVNKRKAELGTQLKDGDSVWALPLAHGG